MKRAAARAAAIVLGAALLAACASRDLVVVLPEHDGHVGTVVVGPGPGQVVLHKPYAAARPGPDGARPFTSNSGRVSREFGSALAALPEAPKVYRLNFVFGSDEMTAEAKREFERVFPEIARRPAPELVVTGHTDTMGTAEINDPLSYARAQAIADLLVSRGVPRDSITVAGRGSREPLVHTGEGVANPENRRVEITVR